MNKAKKWMKTEYAMHASLRIRIRATQFLRIVQINRCLGFRRRQVKMTTRTPFIRLSCVNNTPKLALK